jgi:hypothetical protein
MQTNEQSLSRHEIIDLTRDLLAERVELSFDRFQQETGIPAEIVQHSFGGWPGLLREAGRPCGFGRWADKPSDEELITQLQQLGLERGNSVTQEQFARHAGVSVSFIYRRFGSWRNLRAAAGMWRKSMPAKLYTNRELLDDMLRFYLRYDRQHTYWNHAAVAGAFSANAIRRRYGSWCKAVDVFDLYKQEYFLARDPNWSSRQHAQTFRPQIFAEVQWPRDMDGLDWDPVQGWTKLSSRPRPTLPLQTPDS